MWAVKAYSTSADCLLSSLSQVLGVLLVLVTLPKGLAHAARRLVVVVVVAGVVVRWLKAHLCLTTGHVSTTGTPTDGCASPAVVRRHTCQVARLIEHAHTWGFALSVVYTMYGVWS